MIQIVKSGSLEKMESATNSELALLIGIILILSFGIKKLVDIVDGKNE